MYMYRLFISNIGFNNNSAKDWNLSSNVMHKVITQKVLFGKV